MAMHQGFDLSRFKKVSSDKNSTTMRHANGHEVKIVHSALSAAMRSQIDALPTHEAPVKMARGGAVKRMPVGGAVDSDAMDNDSPAQTDDGSTPAQAPGAPASDDASDMKAALQASNENPPTVDNPTFTQDQSPVPDQDSAPTQQTPTMQSLTQEQQAWQNDLQNGHITPETYQDLFAKKDTLSKIGTIFGLMVGGGPSTNTAYQMMNNELQNDLKAQTQSKTNAVNYYNAYTSMLQGTANAENVASHTTMNNMQNSLYQYLLDQGQKIPPGPYQQKYGGALQQLGQAIGAQGVQNNAKAVLAANQRTGGQGAPPTFDGPVNQDLLATANMVDPKHWGPAQAEGAKIAQTRQLFKNYTQSWDRLNTMTAGQTPETIALATRALEGTIPLGGLSPAATDLAKKMQGERQAQIASLAGVPQEFLPSGFDFRPGGDNQKARDARKTGAAGWFKLQEGQNPNINMLNKHFPLVTPQPYADWAKSSPPVRTQGTTPIGRGGAGEMHATSPDNPAPGGK